MAQATSTENADRMAEYRRTAEEVVAGLGSDARRGLSHEEARARLERYAPNELEAEKPVPAWRRFLAQFRDTLVILLLVATVISVGLWAYERDSALPYEGIAIFAIVLLNGALGYVQESRAERAVAALREMSAAEASVVRDGERRSIPAAELVPGDVILVEEGDTIPADARLIESTALQASEASLTGESLPVSKDVMPLEEEAGLGDRSNMVFSGTAATYGRGRAVVTATGMQTEHVRTLEWGVTTLPRVGSEKGTWAGSHNFVIPQQRNQDPNELQASKVFINWIGENSAEWAEAGQVPARESVRETQAFQRLKEQTVFAEELAYVHFSPKLPGFDDIDRNALGPALNQALLLTKEPEAALDEANERANQLLKESRETYGE